MSSTTNDIGFIPVIEVLRGNQIESIHYGAVAVVDSTGNLIASVGDPHQITYLRSAAKPFQAIPLIQSGGDEIFKLTVEEIAIICSSHSGTDLHVEVVENLQHKIGIQETDLLCGTHPPIHKPTQIRLIKEDTEPTPIRHNCSGKHTGVLALAKLMGASIKDYISPLHPTQKAILDAFSMISGSPFEELSIGIDGCSLPNYATSLHNSATAFSRLLALNHLLPEMQRATQIISTAMVQYPEIVGGPDRFDSDLMIATKGRLLAKVGAESCFGIAISPEDQDISEKGIGLFFKISDGDMLKRALPVLVLAVLEQLGLITDEETEKLDHYSANKPRLNWRGLDVGSILACHNLRKYT